MSLKVSSNTIDKASIKAYDFFKEPFGDKAIGINLDEEEFNHFSGAVALPLFSSDSLQEFIEKLVVSRSKYQQILGFDDDFPWVNHCVKSAMIYVGKGETKLSKYSWVHANDILIKHYEFQSEERFLELLNKHKTYHNFHD